MRDTGTELARLGMTIAKLERHMEGIETALNALIALEMRKQGIDATILEKYIRELKEDPNET